MAAGREWIKRNDEKETVRGSEKYIKVASKRDWNVTQLSGLLLPIFSFDNRCTRGENDRLEIYRSRRNRLLIITRCNATVIKKDTSFASPISSNFFAVFSRFSFEDLYRKFASCYIHITQIEFNLTSCAYSIISANEVLRMKIDKNVCFFQK